MPTEQTRLIKINAIILCLLVLLFGLLWMSEAMSNILILMGAALIGAYLLLGPVHLMEHTLQRYLPRLFAGPRAAGRRHLTAIVTVLLIFFSALSFTVLQFLPPLSRQVAEFATVLPSYLERIETQVRQYSINTPQDNLLAQLLQRLVSGQSTKPGQTPFSTTSQLLAEIEEEDPGTILNRLGGILRQTGSDATAYLLNIGAGTLSTLIYGLTGLILMFYLLMDGHKLKRGFISLLPATLQKGTEAFMSHFHYVFYHFIKSQVLLSLLGGLYLYMVYSVLGLKFAFLLSFAFGLTSIIPVIGPWFGLMPTVILLLVSKEPFRVVPLLLAVGLYYVLKVYWLSPKLIKPSLVIHPVIFILTFLLCIKSASLFAVLLSFPLASLICVMVLFLKDETLNLYEAPADLTAEKTTP